MDMFGGDRSLVTKSKGYTTPPVDAVWKLVTWEQDEWGYTGEGKWQVQRNEISVKIVHYTIDETDDKHKRKMDNKLVIVISIPLSVILVLAAIVVTILGGGQ